MADKRPGWLASGVEPFDYLVFHDHPDFPVTVRRVWSHGQTRKVAEVADEAAAIEAARQDNESGYRGRRKIEGAQVFLVSGAGDLRLIARVGVPDMADPTPRALERAQRMLEDARPDVCGDSTVVEGFWIESHTIGCREAADTTEEEWWDEHWRIYDEYAVDGQSNVLGDPADGVFVTLTPQKTIESLKQRLMPWP